MLLSVKLQHLVRWTEASVDSIDALLMPDGQYSVILYECRTTALTWVLERIGYWMTCVTRCWDSNYCGIYLPRGGGQPCGYISGAVGGYPCSPKAQRISVTSSAKRRIGLLKISGMVVRYDEQFMVGVRRRRRQLTVGVLAR